MKPLKQYWNQRACLSIFYSYFTVQAHTKFTKEIPKCSDGGNDITFELKSEVEKPRWYVFALEMFEDEKKVKLLWIF